uniref:TSL-kinase interacting protein 1 n=1 Tax=Chenopodium quinoa TaxID=63459 RepID=A0A803NDM7_CHEQI
MQSPEKVPLQCLKQHSPCTDVSHSDGPPTITSTSDNGVASQPAKRPTRQWAAWTREEEESFFTALRQVGKASSFLSFIGENHSSSLPTATNQNKLSANDARAVKIVLVDSQNGAVTAAALKRWEKAAMAGVSLVADAAEHLERTAGENCTFHQGQLNCTEQTDLGPSMQEQVNLSNISKSMAIEDHVQATMKLQLNCTEKTDLGPSVQEQVNLSNISKSMAIEDNVQATMKLKLQLFPIDQTTRKALEMDKRNPFLELTLSTRKKISSILEHLDRKWGNSSVASGELMLFPSNIQRENLVRYQRWTRDSDVTAAEVYAVIGSPAVFRLRYGWISSTELQSRISQTTYQTLEKQKRALKESAVATFGEANKNADVELSNDIFEMHNLGSSVLSKKYEPCDESNFTKFKTLVDQRARKSTSLSTREWADSLTNASVGELLTEDVDVMDANGVEILLLEVHSVLRQFRSLVTHLMQQLLPIYIDKARLASLDPLHIHHQFGMLKKRVMHFHFRTELSLTTRMKPWLRKCLGRPMDECASETHETGNSAKDFSSLTDIYWPDSLGPLELDIPSCKYYSEDLILSDSLSGLNRLLASSLDAFQNCPFFGLDEKRPPSPTTGTQGGASFAGKIDKSDKAGVQSLQV